MESYLIISSPIGKIMITEQDNKITQIKLTDEEVSVVNNNISELLIKTRLELEEYFCGQKTNFDIPTSLNGSDFQVRVWNELLNIPYGEVRTYGEIAKLVGNENASRAVGMACNKNPLMIIVPCHRVIGKNKKLVGYEYGIDIKQKLLDLESSRFDE